MEVIIAEKPKAASKIASSLGTVKYVRKGFVTVCEIPTRNIVVAPAVGHIFALAEKTKSRNYPVFDVEWKPIFEVSQLQYSKPYYAVLRDLLKNADSITIACDFDTEGTLIGYNISRFLSKFKPTELKRMKFSTLTPGELRDAYEKKGEFDMGNALAGEARHTLDWYYGINLSRALMGALAKANRPRIMSIGRVQGPTLNLVCEKEESITSFKPETYFDLFAKIKGFEFEYEKNPIKIKEEGESLLSKTGETAKIVSIEKEEKLVPPYPPFDLTSLQIEAAKHFGFSPSRTLQIAQSLYENSYISYPRTSSQKLPPSIGYKSIIEKLSKTILYKELAEKLLALPYLKPVEGRKEDPAHPAIYPTGVYGEMNEEDKKLYDLIVKRFLSVFYGFAKKESTHVKADAGIIYKGHGAVIVQKAWIEIYGKYYKGEDKELPQFKEGEICAVESKNLIEKQTQPPKRYSAASLISELEKRSLGTKATRASIIDTLYKRMYIMGMPIAMTSFGKAVHSTLKKYVPTILDENLTREIEDDMEKISAMQMPPEKVIEKGKTLLEKILKEFKENELNIGNELVAHLDDSYANFAKKAKSKESGAKSPKAKRPGTARLPKQPKPAKPRAKGTKRKPK